MIELENKFLTLLVSNQRKPKNSTVVNKLLELKMISFAVMDSWVENIRTALAHFEKEFGWNLVKLHKHFWNCLGEVPWLIKWKKL